MVASAIAPSTRGVHIPGPVRPMVLAAAAAAAAATDAPVTSTADVGVGAVFALIGGDFVATIPAAVTEHVGERTMSAVPVDAPRPVSVAPRAVATLVSALPLLELTSLLLLLLIPLLLPVLLLLLFPLLLSPERKLAMSESGALPSLPATRANA